MSRSPSKRVLWTMVATVAIVGGTIATSAVLDARDRRERADPSNPALPITIGRDAGLATSEDQDGDSLLDWEEALRGTNPLKADTDGDGTSDGAEVAAGRDPNVAGPNDFVAELASTTDATLSARYQANRQIGTLTDQFAENFASQYVALKADGGFTAADQATLLSTISGISGGGVSTLYRSAIIPRISDEGTETLSAYADAIAEAHANTIIPIASEMQRGAGTESFGQGFRELGRSLAGIPTPAALVESQAKLANAYETMGSVVLLLSANNDPLGSLVAIPALQKAEDARVFAAQSIAVHLASKGVSLQSGPHGNFWSKMIEAQ